jgi:hypothetical protein
VHGGQFADLPSNIAGREEYLLTFLSWLLAGKSLMQLLSGDRQFSLEPVDGLRLSPSMVASTVIESFSPFSVSARGAWGASSSVRVTVW